MRHALQWQGGLFCLAVFAVVALGLAGIRFDTEGALVAAALLILLLGMPHGALDAVIVHRLFGAVGAGRWARFSLVYLGLAAAVVGVWFVAPTAFLVAFLVFSTWHFGGDLAAGAPTFSRIAYGGAVIVLPALWHGDELQRLLALVAGPASAAFVAPVLRELALPWLLAMALTCALALRSSWLAACEIGALAALALAAPPLVAFCVYFCAMHSPRHIISTLAPLPALQIRQAITWALWPTLATLAIASLLAALLREVPLETRVMQIIFVGLAALTLPHMALLERLRRSGGLGPS